MKKLDVVHWRDEQYACIVAESDSDVSKAQAAIVKRVHAEFRAGAKLKLMLSMQRLSFERAWRVVALPRLSVWRIPRVV